MKTAAIIPVKTFSKSKSRLQLPSHKKEQLCKLMLDEILSVVSSSELINEIVLVTKDPTVSITAKNFDVTLLDDTETGVNDAVLIADNYLTERNFSCSIVFPQDIPAITKSDIQSLIDFQKSPSSVIVVPSRHFDGTNALLRSPPNMINSQYDFGSYSFQVNEAKTKNCSVSVSLIHRMMIDIDHVNDLHYFLSQNNKPKLVTEIKKIIT